MSTYRFIMRNYHAVKEADIEIAGMTVVGGVNGCGKSTLARWLNYVVNVLNNYDRYVIDDARRSYKELIQVISRASNISLTLRMEWRKENARFTSSYDLSELQSYFHMLVDRFVEMMTEKLRSRIWQLNRRRLSSLFDLEEKEGESLSDFLSRLTDYLYTEDDKIYSIAIERLERHSMKNWREILLDRIDLNIDSSRIDLEFTEDSVTLLGDKEFSLPLMLHNAVYINTQEISATLGSSLYESGDLSQLLQTKAEQSTVQGRVLAKIIKSIIGGEVVIDTNVFADRRDRLRFVRPDGLDILLRGAATGIISFAILLQLLENGWITENTMLIIDEPEAHLHPQWIVEYARVLVKINKTLGTKILVSTHNPDMLAALQSISEREGTLNESCFYLAEKTDEDGRYYYRKLGKEVGPIFDSFNIALDRIELYGMSGPYLE
ncbi:MAG: ATP-binding protein [Duncaniella sp.]|nr:ATP-binding protein [Duncaniella sp.]